MRKRILQHQGMSLSRFCQEKNLSYTKVYELITEQKYTIEEAIEMVYTGRISPKQKTPNKCVKCGSEYIKIRNIDGLYYIQCDKCTKWNPYQFLGINIRNAMDEWNFANRPIGRGKYLKKKKDNL